MLDCRKHSSRRDHPALVVRIALAGLALATMAAARLPGEAGAASASVSAAGSSNAECSMTTCYSPQQFEVAYGVQPLLRRGIDGRGETVVLPELAESRLSPPQVTDLRRDLTAFDRRFHLPAPRLRFVSTFAGRRLAAGRFGGRHHFPQPGTETGVQKAAFPSLECAAGLGNEILICRDSMGATELEPRLPPEPAYGTSVTALTLALSRRAAFVRSTCATPDGTASCRGNAEDAPLPRHTFQRAHAEIFKFDPGTRDQVFHGGGHEHFAGTGECGRPRTDVYGDTRT